MEHGPHGDRARDSVVHLQPSALLRLLGDALGWTLAAAGAALLALHLVGLRPASAWLAAGFCLSGLGLALETDRERDRAAARFASAVCAAVPAFLGLLSLVQALVNGPADGSWQTGARAPWMAPAPALSFAFVGAGMLLGRPHATWAAWLSQTLWGAVTAGAFLSLVMVLLGVNDPHSPLFFVSVAPMEAVLFLALALGCLCRHPDQAWMKPMADTGPGGLMLRRMLPFVVGVPVAIGWARLRLQRAGLVDLELGLGFVTVGNVLALSLVAWLASRPIRLGDTRRLLAEMGRAQAETRYRATLDHLLEGCQVIGSDWRYRYVNETAAAQGRRARADLEGRTMTECYPGIERTELFETLRRCMADRRPKRMDNRFEYPDGETAWFRLFVDPVPEGVFVLSLDITQAKRAEEDQARYRLRLEEEVLRRTAQLEDANRELEAFTYTVSHDLRAPLRHLTGFSDLLERHATNGLDEKARGYLRTISRSATEMGALIDDLLAFSRMGREEIRKSSVDLTAMVRRIIEDLPQEAVDRGVRFDINPLPTVQADPSLLMLAVRNLIENAVKYTRTKLDATVRVDSVQKDGEVVISVQDNGVGFDPRYVDKLFGVFQRLHRAEEFEGTGIGLASVRRIIGRHGGRTWAQGEVGKGACFWFSLPLVASQALEPPESARPLVASQPRAGAKRRRRRPPDSARPHVPGPTEAGVPGREDP